MTKIHVTAGSLDGISIEIFSNFFKILTLEDQKKFTLYGDKSQINRYLQVAGLGNLENCNIFDISKNTSLNSEHNSTVVKSLDYVFTNSGPNDFLLTLPATKKEFLYKDTSYSGHTEFFRHYFSNHHLPMVFLGHKFNLLLLTDHVPLNSVTNILTRDFIFEKVKMTLDKISQYTLIKKVIFLGINPHAGEGGIIGSDEVMLNSSIELLKNEFKSKFSFSGPTPADTALIHSPDPCKETLIISPYHDQGLALFKSVHGMLGVNITLGLPLLRISPDHGTAPSLLFKNQANYSSLFYCWDQIKKIGRA